MHNYNEASDIPSTANAVRILKGLFKTFEGFFFIRGTHQE